MPSSQAKDGLSAWISTQVKSNKSSSLLAGQAGAGEAGGPEGHPQGTSTRQGLESSFARGPRDGLWKLAVATRAWSTGGSKVYDNAAAAPFGEAAAAVAAATPSGGQRASFRIAHASSGSEEDSPRWCVGRITLTCRAVLPCILNATQKISHLLGG